MPNPVCPEDTIVVRSLRPLTWLGETGCQPGRTMLYSLAEMGLAGTALVVSVGPCPPLEDGPGRVVLSTVTHFNGLVLRIWLDGLAEPLEPTSTHRLYSEDRADWVPVEQLVVGERLRTLHGPLAVMRIESKPGVHRVYNLEVETEHCYYVSTRGVLSHNQNPCAVSGRYWYLDLRDAEAASRGAGKDYTYAQRRNILDENMVHNHGVIQCEETGTLLVREAGHWNTAEIDHIVPKSKGGTNHYSNARVVCRSTNRSRGNR